MAEALVIPSTPINGVRVLAINRPNKRNALSGELISVLLEQLATAANDNVVRVIIVTGTSTYFSAGADIKEISEMDAEGARGCRYLSNLCDGMRAVRKPLIAAVEGMALGGGFEVALMCDLIFASNVGRFGLPEITLGLIPGAGGTQRLTNVVGKFKAMQMILLATPIPATEAFSLGLVAQLFEPGTVLEQTIEIASKLAASSATALSLAKEAVCRADDLGRDDEFERSLYYFAFGTQDKKEGIEAFLKKRQPNWQLE
ncbi:ClpP/crotonase-like domain-containing protein [Dactylonectria estremocensis]|uniref:ClpP/crotonase-like domain-containing protein n=1 Tax=Dactylonectria estremocensis TaxID=1079267 RepID=A0A9P9FGE8_9HYPO|nr:ClpP/crotonase-like domain-containing protein [Dactylonectria estremocensis]